MVRKIVRVGKIVICGVIIIFVWVLLSIVFYFGVGGCVLRLRNERLVVEIIEVLMCMVKNIMIEEMVLGRIWCNKMVILLVLILCVDLIKVCCFNISVLLCIRWVNVGMEKMVIVIIMLVMLFFNIVIIVIVSKIFGKVNSIL